MSAEQIRDFMIGYHSYLQKIIMEGQWAAHEFEPCAGDASISIFKQRSGEERKEKCRRALKAAINIAMAVEAGKIPYTRIGIYVGEIIEAPFGKQTLRFGNSFAAASRLEGLCSYFGTMILMDRDIALAQDTELKYIVAIGKITPKNFEHPIHVYSIYKPGIHNCPFDINEEKLTEFIRLKNEGIELFVGNAKKDITSDFPLADSELRKASILFKEITGILDVATLRISEYIHEHPYPVDTFERKGMAIDEKQGQSLGIRLLLLSQHLIKAFDHEFYHMLVENTDWESYFKIEWIKKGKTVIRIGDEPDGIYYLARGEVRVENAEGDVITTLSEGDIFGEMAYFSENKKRSATVVAITDIAVRKISTEDFQKTPILHKLFAELTKRRISPV